MPHNEFRTVPGAAPAPVGVAPFRFVTLGRLALCGPDGAEVLGSQRRKLALLAMLALAERPVTRESLVETFWGDEDDDRARHSLSNALSFLRRILGPASITVRRTEVSLAPETPLRVDARALLAAAADKRHEDVVALYTGPFLDGIYVPGSQSFESWASGQRARIESAFLRACSTFCTAAATDRDWDRCASVAAKWLEHAPLSPEAALHLLNATRAGKTPEHRQAALAEYERLVVRLERDYETTPHPRVVELARQIAERVEADHADARALELQSESLRAQATARDANVVMPPGVAGEPPEAVAPPPPDGTRIGAEPRPASPVGPASAPMDIRWRRALFTRRRSNFAAAGLLVIGVVAAVLVRLSMRSSEASAAAPRPLMVVTDIANLRGDTANAWLQDGLAQMLAADLGRSGDVEVVAPSRVRDTRLRAELAESGALPQDDALDLARRLGAQLALRGGFTHGNGMYVLDVDLRDVKSGRSIRALTVTGPDPMSLADQAAARVLSWAAASDARPRFAEIETPSIPAYEYFVRGMQALGEGRIAEGDRDLDAAIALDSGFADAVQQRLSDAERDGDGPRIARLAALMRRARLSAFDVLRLEIDSAEHDGERVRSELLARQLVARYPHDPRSYEVLVGIHGNRGDWGIAEETAEHELALDSLAMSAGNGPCVPCGVFDELAVIRGMERLDLAGAERAARRWVALQPEAPGAWASLATVLGIGGRHDAAVDAERRALMLSGNDPHYAMRVARALLLARRFDAADSLARSWQGSNPELREGATDIHVLVLRERGQWRASIRAAQAALGTHPDEALLYEELDGLGRIGDYQGAVRLFNTAIAGSAAARAAPQWLRGDYSRWFTWTRALAANALAPAGDTVWLRAVADSMRTASVRSYYGRDEHLPHHLLGLIAMRADRFAEAEREFQGARWSGAGWTATIVWLARAQLAQHRPKDAIATLRIGYEGPLDAMGRYVPRSEIDYYMALAFRQAGVRDSASVYAGYVRSAWRNADPEARSLLASLQ